MHEVIEQEEEAVDSEQDVSPHIPPRLNNKIYTKGQYPYKLVILIFTLQISIVAFYCFDQPAALYYIMREHFQNHDDSVAFHIYFAALYTFYSIANIFLPFFTGGLRDCNGDRIVIILLCILMITGQIIFSYGVYSHSIIVMLCGRLLLGWGVEALLPIQTSFVSLYFREKYMATILSIIQFCCFIGLIISIYFVPIIANNYGLIMTLASAVAFILLGIILLSVSLYLDFQVEKTISKIFPSRNSKATNTFQFQKYQSDIFCIQKEVIRETQFYFFKLEDLYIYPRIFWLILIYHTVFYCSILTIINVNINLIVELLLMTTEGDEIRITWEVAKYWTLGCFALPIAGLVADKIGKRAIISIFAAIVLIFGHFIYFFYPAEGLFILAIAFSFQFAALWSAIINIQRPQAIGKAFGMIISFQHLGFSVLPIWVVVIRKITGSIILGQFVLPILGCIALASAYFIYKEDKKQSNLLDRLYICYFPADINYQAQQKYRSLDSSISGFQEDLFTNNIRQKIQNN